VGRLLVLVALCACGRLGFDSGTNRDGGTGDADIDAFELIREDGGVDKVCASPLAPDAFSVGRHHACAHNGMALYCWGGNESGQLGLGDTASRTTPIKIVGAFTGVGSVRGDHVCALETNTLYCWGANGEGQLGLGDTMPRTSPTQIGTGYSGVASGNAHTCALSAGELYCWGRNDHGQLGLGDMTPRSSPTMVATDMWVGITLGTDTTCAPVRVGVPIGLSCWGRNDRGQLGLADTADRSTPTGHGCCDIFPRFGGAHTVASRAAGVLVVWGANESGQLGLGDTADRTTETQVNGAWGSPSAGDAHSCVIQGMTRELYCWGANDRGQLGLGMAGPPVLMPTKVGTDADWANVVAGGRSTCASKMDGRIFCWGANDVGQLGIGHTVQRSRPVQVCLGE
jgi:alpha-tubulin suppressor-like RCC1 family protein